MHTTVLASSYSTTLVVVCYPPPTPTLIGYATEIIREKAENGGGGKRVVNESFAGREAVMANCNPNLMYPPCCNRGLIRDPFGLH